MLMKRQISKIGVALLLLSLICMINPLQAQNITDFKDKDENAIKNIIGNDYFFAVRNKSFKNKDVKEVEQELETELKTALAKKIISKVQVENSSNLSQITFNDNKKNNSSFVMNYNFTTNVESKITFTEPVVKFNYDNKNKILYGLITVVKKDFLDQNYAKLNFELSRLLNEVDNVNQGSSNARTSSIKLKEFKEAKNELYSLINVQNTLDPQRIDDNFQSRVKDLDAKLTTLLSSIESNDFQDAIIAAKTKLLNINAKDDYREYKDAINDFDLLLVRYPGNTTIMEEKEKALDIVLAAFSNKVASNDFLEALDAIKTLSKIDQSFIIKFEQQKSLLIKSAFELYFEKASRSVAARDYNNAKQLLKKIEEYKYYNSIKYESLLSQIDDNIYKERLRDIDLLILNKKFLEAYRIILEAKKEFILKNLTELNDREDRVVNALTEEKVNEIKKKRPYTWQLQLGGGLISNFYNIQPKSNIADYQVQTASTTYEFGIYHKVNIKENFNQNGKDRSRSSAIGIKVAVWVPQQSYSFTSASSTPLQGGLYFKSNIIEPQLSMFVLKMFNLNVGKIMGDIIDKQSNTVLNTKQDFYTLTFGLRPKIGNLMLNLNAKLISDMAQSNYVTANASLVLAINFARRFKGYEYDEVKNAVLKMKNY